MARADSQDTYARPVDDAVASDRHTPALLGGAVGVDPAAAAAAFGRRRGPARDGRASEAWQRRHDETTPRVVRLRGSAVATAGTPTVVAAGGPQLGFTWHVRRLNVGPVDYSAGSFPTGITVIAALAGAEEPGMLADSAYNVFSSTTAYPSEGTWGLGELTLLPGDHLRIIVVGLGTGVTVSIGGQALELATDVAHLDVAAI